MSAGHAVPLYCAYCGEEDLEPQGEHGEWRCGACLRTFTVRFLGVAGRQGSA